MSANTRARRTTKRRTKKNKAPSRVLLVVSILALLAILIAVGFSLHGGYEVYLTSSYHLDYQDYVLTYAHKYDIAPSLVYGIIRTESNFKPDVESSVGAKGLMQLTVSTFEWVQARSDELDNITPEQMTDPETNIHCGVYVLKLLMELFDDEDTVIAAYNAGLGNVQDWLDDPAYSHDGVKLHTIPYEETRNYVQRVRSSQSIYQQYYHVDDVKGES